MQRKKGNGNAPAGKSFLLKTPCWVLEAILSGTGILESDGSRHALKAGDVFLLPPFTRSVLLSEGETPLVSRFLRIRDNAVMAGMGESLSLKNAGIFHFPEQNFVRVLVEEILKTASSGETEEFSSTEEKLSLLCYKLFYLLSRRKRADAGESRFELFLRHLAATPGRPHTLASMAEWCGVTPRTLTRLFRKKLSTSPIQYLAGIRLEYAAMLFRKEDPPPAVK
ncbi:MAG: AraC family ligand binding domain-containing protein, partial [Lentisphaeria bacterium]|nr:AraC family ligand binding domain-containing protein [Lentisphaeria bacterium]